MRKRTSSGEWWKHLPALDDGEDETSRVEQKTPVALATHLEHVRNTVAAFIGQLPVEGWADAFLRAAELHDWGKADERFQAYLLCGSLHDVAAQPSLWAKHPDAPASYRQHLRATLTSGRPEGFRHEMLSVQMADFAAERLPEDDSQRDLTLHLIASHHGRARPFAPVVMDNNPPDVVLDPLGVAGILTAERRKESPLHRLDSGIAERYWLLTRRFGWWGLAYLETILRLADQRASQREEEGSLADDAAKQPAHEEACT